MHKLRHWGRHAAWIPPLLVVFLVLGVIWQRQNILDAVRLQGYEPAPAVVSLADQIQLTDTARRVFYVNHPAIEDRDTFNKACQNRGEQTIVLGCYHPIDRGIFVYHVGDSRLNGVDQVTAAHEMLHAAYDRLNSSQKKRINSQLMAYYSSGNLSQRLKTVIASYQKTEPDDVPNEMHSIFGTEIADLPPELTQYYQKYFTNRTAVVKYAASYQAEFSSRQEQIDSYDRQLTNLRQQIEKSTETIKQTDAAITTDRKRLDGLRSSSISAYNAAVPAYNARIDSYNATVNATRAQISTYNNLVEKRNQIAGQVTDLAHSIDSQFQPINQ